MKEGMTQLEAIETVLSDSPVPLTDDEIANAITALGLARLTGSTKAKTVTSRISIDIKLNGDASRFKRVKARRGVVRYTLRDRPEQEFFPPRRNKRIKKDELVLVFDPAILNSLGYFEGVTTNFREYLTHLLNPTNSFFVRRKDAENTEDFKQIISYAIIRFENKLLQYTRGGMTNVADLEGFSSVGFGGHVQFYQDYSMFETDMGYLNSITREITEETSINIPRVKVEDSIVGLLNDESSDLGRKHFAIIHMIDLENIAFQDAPGIRRMKEKRENPSAGKIGELSIRNFTFTPFEEIEENFYKLEDWSKISVASFFGDKLHIKSQVEARKQKALKAKILVVTGRIGSGKSEACRILEESFGYRVIRTSSVLKKLLGLEDQMVERRNLQTLGLEYVSKPNGHLDLANGLVWEIGHKDEKIVIDGIRFPETLEALEKTLNSKFSTIYLENTSTRSYEFYKARELNPVSQAEFSEIIAHPVERQVSRFKQMSDYVVYNYGSLNSFRVELTQFFQREIGNG